MVSIATRDVQQVMQNFYFLQYALTVSIRNSYLTFNTVESENSEILPYVSMYGAAPHMPPVSGITLTLSMAQHL